MPRVHVPPFAWSGWRLRIPGNPTEGGQYHGLLGDSAGPWVEEWAGVPLAEGENRSDYVYRSSAEIPPRANASGGANVITEFQTRRTAGFAEAPGSYRGIGLAVVSPRDGVDYPFPYFPRPIASVPIYHPPINIVRQPPPPVRPQPAPVISTTAAAAATAAALKAAAAKAAAVQAAALKAAAAKDAAAQAAALKAAGAKATAAQVAAVNAAIAKAKATDLAAEVAAETAASIANAGSAGCAAGMVRDAAGNCTLDSHNPYVLYLPDTAAGASPAPAPTVAAPSTDLSTGLPLPGTVANSATGTCSYTDANGNCTNWFGAETLISGVPNMYILAGAAAAAFLLMSSGGRSGARR